MPGLLQKQQNEAAEPSNLHPAKPHSTERIAELSRNLAQAAHLLASGTHDTEALARLQVVGAAQELLGAVRPPPETVMGWFQQSAVVSAVHIFQDWNAFDALPLDSPITYAELAAKVHAEEAILTRIAWMLTSAGVLQPIGLDSLAHTPVSLILREDEPMGSMFKVMHNHVVETSAVLPAYFASYGRREPVGLAPIPTSFLAGAPNLPHFELLHRDPAAMKTFMHAMSISHRRVPTVGMYDPAWVLDKVAADEAAGGSDRPVWVDIGGGSGHALLLFLRAYPALPADRCVVQDLPEVVEEAARTAHEEELRSVRWSAMDFHSESPVPGAMIYFLRHILRDFSDSVAVGILRNIASSMTEDSRLLISEQVTVTPPPLYSAFKDYVMMAIGGKERTMENFRDVVEAAGLSISGVFPDRGTPHAVIECARVMA